MEKRIVMLRKEIITEIYELSDLTQLSHQEQQLIEQSLIARSKAYAPYSGFQVGAALLFDDGTFATGSNQENAAYPSGLCAERVAIFYANSQFPEKTIQKIAVTAGRGDRLTDIIISPCGACRQVLLESELRQKSPIEVLLVGNEKVVKLHQCADLLPLAFTGKEL